MAALLFRPLHGLNTLHTFLQCIRTIHFGSVKCSWARPGSWDLHCCPLCAYTASAESPPHCRRQGSCSAFQVHLPSSLSLPKDELTEQQDPTLTFSSSLRSHSSRQAGAGSSPGAVLYNTSSAAAGKRGERKSSDSSYGEQAGEMDWGKRGELPWESSAKPPALHRDKPAPFLP